MIMKILIMMMMILIMMMMIILIMMFKLKLKAGQVLQVGYWVSYFLILSSDSDL